MHTFPFQHEGQNYEIRITTEGNRIIMRAFRDGSPANGYTYSVDFPKVIEMGASLGRNAITELVKSAVEDVKTGRWEALLKAFREQP